MGVAERRARHNAKRRQRRRENPEQARAQDRAKYARNPAYYAQAASRRRAADPAKYRRRRRVYNYGLAYRDFLELWNLQAGRCAICRERLIDDGSRQTHVDHDHRTGAVRGLLCSDCNVGLGRFHDNPIALSRAAEYVASR